MKPLPKNYDHTEAEPRLQKRWEESRVHAWDESQPRANTFVIDTPPPTVSGILHMGHIFSYTQADFVARFQRMNGKTVFYPMGFDDNGLPTERLVEKEKKVRGSAMPREEFVALCREVVKSAEDEFRRLFKGVALSVDWQQEYQTISDEVRRLSQLSFLDLLKKGEAYRDFRPTYWDWVDQTAIAQAEIENKEMPGVMNEILFALESLKPSPACGRGLGEGASPTWKNTRELVEIARTLRKTETQVEAVLWSCLRDRQLQGFKFRRQHPIEHYIADFACVENKLLVELDGGQHNQADAQTKDMERTEFLESRGFKVLRFWNNDVSDNLEGVLETILSTLKESSPHPTLSRERERAFPAPTSPFPLPQAGEGQGEGSQEIVIATTRPELLGACVAVMYHPQDPNAAKYEGKTAVTPVFGVKVPMIADEAVEQGKGTGLVMCCTFGDDTDKEWWRKYKLPLRALLTEQGKIDFENTLFTATFIRSNNAEDIYNDMDACIRKNDKAQTLQGLKPKQANAKMIELLQAEGKLLKQTNITHTVKCAERSGTPIEIIPTYQWFVKVTDKKDALKAKGDQCKWYPEFMHIRLNQWIEGLKEDWCISRQRFFGVPFPVWYSRRAGEEGKVLFADASRLPVDPLTDLPEGYTREEVIGSADVMDTWATSSISPQINAGSLTPILSQREGEASAKKPSPSGRGLGEGISAGERYAKLFPADLRPQAHEIIRTWAFYTLVKAHLHADSIPWKNLMISGWCLASDKTKMSKSKGNVVTPVDLIREKGADVVRYWASTSRLGADTAFSEDLLKIGKKLVTKLWNATAFAAIHLTKLNAEPGTAAEDVADGRITEALDRWILSRLHKTVAKATEEFANFEYCDARMAVEEFFWKDFCDNYLELVKARAYGEIGVAKAQASAHHTLYHCLNTILRLFAPFLPHVTEELYSHLFDAEHSIHARGTWPKAVYYPADEAAEASGTAAVSILEFIRKKKSEKNVSIKFPIKKLILSAGGSRQGKWETIAPILDDLKSAGNVESIEWSDKFTDREWIADDGCYGINDIIWGEQTDAA